MNIDETEKDTAVDETEKDTENGMTISDIINSVRLCIDEESNNTSLIADEKDDSYMDNIIRAKINDSLHWLAVTASTSPLLADSKKFDTSTTTINVEDFDTSKNIGVIEMDDDTEVIHISRVRGKGWYKAVVPVDDTEDEALLMFDNSACGTTDRPQASIMRDTPIKILLQPKPEEATVSFVGVPKNVTITTDTTKVNVPDKLKNSFIYYLAFLLLTAYDDTKATQMYTVALQQLGINQTSK